MPKDDKDTAALNTDLIIWGGKVDTLEVMRRHVVSEKNIHDQWEVKRVNNGNQRRC